MFRQHHDTIIKEYKEKHEFQKELKYSKFARMKTAEQIESVSRSKAILIVWCKAFH